MPPNWRARFQEEGRADPVAQYLRALEEGDARDLERAWPGQVVVYDPLVGEVQGHRDLRHFLARNRAWLSDHRATTHKMAAIRVGRRAVVELVATLEVTAATSPGRSRWWPTRPTTTP